jgi:tryptophan synthase alpha chain
MNRLDEAFAACRAERRAAFIPFIMAGDPDLATTFDLIGALVEGGADVIELGVPFSDPIADGPVNQRAAVRGLASGTTLAGVLELVARARVRWEVPIVLFSYFNPILAQGLGEFAARAAASGVDGVLCLDLPPEEAVPDFTDALTAVGLAPIFLLAPTSTPARVKRVDRIAAGFVYYVSRTGVTGVQDELAPELLAQAKRVRRQLHHPLAVGFGIATAEQAAAVGATADGVVVGSALVRVVEEHGRSAAGPLAAAAGELSAALRPRRKRWLAR